MKPTRRMFPLLLCLAILLVIWRMSLPNTSTSYTKGGTLVDRRGCSKKRKLAFLKTHKCASSSLQNILMRFGLKNQLNFVLPSAGNYLGRYIKYFHKMVSSTLWDQVGLEYDIFCLHTIWNFQEVSDTLGPEATYFTIMRDPVDLFESLWGYSGMSSFYNMDLETFAKSPKTGKLAMRAFRNLGRNQMLWDLGLPADHMDNMTAVQAKIEEVDSTFQLVMMADRFEESMVLLRDLLCWDYQDVVNFKLNARKENKKAVLSDEAKSSLKEYLAADYVLYKHFLTKFDKHVAAFSLPRMAQELQILRKNNQDIRETCSIKPMGNEKVFGENKLWGGEGLVAYVSNNTANPDCHLFSLSEVHFIDELREVQTLRAEEVVRSMKKGERSSEEVGWDVQKGGRSSLEDLEFVISGGPAADNQVKVNNPIKKLKEMYLNKVS